MKSKIAAAAVEIMNDSSGCAATIPKPVSGVFGVAEPDEVPLPDDPPPPGLSGVQELPPGLASGLI